MRHSETPEVTKLFAWIPCRSTSGSLIWFSHYYVEKRFTNVEPKHRWVNVIVYTEWEYFWKRMGDG
jgi:hypothetical protein